jgi:AcrR family transcriptional regulator
MKPKAETLTTVPIQQRSLRSRDAILEAAEHIFSQKGFDGATVDEIAEYAGINKQRIYAYFGSKIQLYRQILIRVYGQAAHYKPLMSISEKDVKKLTAIILKSLFEFHKTHPRFWRLLAWENLNGQTVLSTDDWKTIKTDYIDRLEGIYKAGQKAGIYKKSIGFGTYLITIFAVTYFYYSNQLTISNLLNLPLTSEIVQKKLASEITQLVETGLLLG